MNHDVNGSGDCAQCANPDLKGLHSCERYSLRSRLGQASAEPTFSYANGALDDAETLQRRAQEAVMRKALASEAKAHQWEHRGPAKIVGLDAFLPPARTFTREEVLTVLSAERAAAAPGTVDEGVLNRLIHIFKRME